MFNSKVIVIVFVIIIVLVVLYITGKKSVHHEIMINANPDRVWSVLINTGAYKEWNPTMLVLKGEVQEGNTVIYQFSQDENNKSEIPSQVKKIIKNELLHQGGGVPLILNFNHMYILEQEGDKTRVTIHEDYDGIWVNFWNPKPVQGAYTRLNEALKKRVESLN
ncbi:conserved hypothetical protein [Tenacibaculum sp. 190524A05c]|uniref:SRPBCC domain-containing protein n=1 Tax=Tenacibaculum platacis TaxID=3137852 RepID=UPI0031FB18BE